MHCRLRNLKSSLDLTMTSIYFYSSILPYPSYIKFSDQYYTCTTLIRTDIKKECRWLTFLHPSLYLNLPNHIGVNCQTAGICCFFTTVKKNPYHDSPMAGTVHPDFYFVLLPCSSILSLIEIGENNSIKIRQQGYETRNEIIVVIPKSNIVVQTLALYRYLSTVVSCGELTSSGWAW